MDENITTTKIIYVNKPRARTVTKILEGMQPALEVLADS
jgi:hypothetical protein